MIKLQTKISITNLIGLIHGGKSVTHKGVDIFAKKGTNIHSATKGLVLLTGKQHPGGKYAVVLGPKWRLYYYAHMNEIKTSALSFVGQKFNRNYW